MSEGTMFLQIRSLSTDLHKRILRISAQETLRQGRRVSMNETLIMLLVEAVENREGKDNG